MKVSLTDLRISCLYRYSWPLIFRPWICEHIFLRTSFSIIRAGLLAVSMIARCSSWDIVSRSPDARMSCCPTFLWPNVLRVRDLLWHQWSFVLWGVDGFGDRIHCVRLSSREFKASLGLVFQIRTHVLCFLPSSLNTESFRKAWKILPRSITLDYDDLHFIRVWDIRPMLCGRTLVMFPGCPSFESFSSSLSHGMFIFASWRCIRILIYK